MRKRSPSLTHHKLKVPSSSTRKLKLPVRSNPTVRSHKTLSKPSLEPPSPKPIPRTLWVSDPTIYSSIAAYKQLIPWVAFTPQPPPSDAVTILSSTDTFMPTYLTLSSHPSLQCTRWLVISSAINRMEIQTNFNHMYQPINFHFLPHIHHAINALTSNTVPTTVDVHKIWVLDRGAGQMYDYVLEYPTDERVIVEEKCMYVVGDVCNFLQRWDNKEEYLVYVVQDDDEFDADGRLCVKHGEGKWVYLLLGDGQTINKLNIEAFQLRWKSTMQNILFQGLPKYKPYVEKMLSLLHDEIVIVFGSQFTKAMREQLRYILCPFTIMIKQQTITKKHPYPFRLLYNTTPAHYSHLPIHPDTLQQQANQYKHQLEEYKQLQLGIKKLKHTLKKCILYYYHPKLSQHLLFQLLHRESIGFEELQNLQHIYETHKIIMIVGVFHFKHISYLETYHNVYVIPCNAEHISLATQLQQTQTFIRTLNKAHDRFYTQQPCAQMHVCLVSNGRFDALQRGLELDGIPGYLMHRCRREELVSLVEQQLMGQHCGVLVLVMMDEWTQQIEKQVGRMHWHNGRGVQVYIRYGEDIIYRGSDGGYQFIKVPQLQSKLNQIIENSEQPQPHHPPLPINLSPTSSHLHFHQSSISLDTPTYRLYICIHRSVPYHSFLCRHKKDYHILLYNRLQEVLLLGRHLKKQQNIIMLVHPHSKPLYQKACARLKLDHERVLIHYMQNMSESCIRHKIDEYLCEHQLNTLVSIDPELNKQLKVLIVYSSTERNNKIINMMRKIFHSQLKIQFISVEEQERMVKGKWMVDSSVSVYGLRDDDGVEQKVKGVKHLFILSMHPNIHHLDGIVGVKFELTGVVKKVMGEGKFERSRNTLYYGEKTSPRVKTMKSTERLPSVSRKRPSFRQTPTHKPSQSCMYVLGSCQVPQQKVTFTNPIQLTTLLMNNHHYQLIVLIIAESQEEEYGKFICSNVVLVLVTADKGKCCFVHDRIVYTTQQLLSDCVQLIYDRYQESTRYDTVRICSCFDNIEHGEFGGGERVLQVMVDSVDKPIKQQKDDGSLKLTLLSSPIQPILQQNRIYLPTLACIQTVLKQLVSPLHAPSNKQPIKIIICPSSIHKLLLTHIKHYDLPHIILRLYTSSNFLQVLLHPTIFQPIILLSKQLSTIYHIKQLSNVIVVDENNTSRLNKVVEFVVRKLV